MCVLRLCSLTNLILHCLHLDFHFVTWGIYLSCIQPVWLCILSAVGVYMWRSTWKRTVERSKTNVTVVIFYHLTLVSESTIVTLHPLKQAIYTYKETRWRKKMNVTLAIMLQLTKVFLWHIWKHTPERNQTSANNVNICLYMKTAWDHIWKHNII